MPGRELPSPLMPEMVMKGAEIDIEATLKSHNASIQACVENVLRRGKASGFAELDANGDVAGYQKTSEKNAASGYAGLDSASYLKQTHPRLHVRDEKADTTQGGTFTSGAWRTRTLNTVKTNEIAGASLASNQITLPPGTYWGEIWAAGYLVNHHNARLQDTTGTVELLRSWNAFSRAAGTVGDVTFAEAVGLFTLTVESILQLQHQCQTTKATVGLGEHDALTIGNEVYASVAIWRLGD